MRSVTVCMYVWIYVCMYVCMYVCIMYVCLCYTYVCMYACMQWPNDLGIPQVIKRSQVHSRCCCHFLEQESLLTLLQSTKLYWCKLAITRHAYVVNLVMPGLCGWGQGRTMGDHTIIHDAWPVLLWTLVLSPGAFGCTDSEYLCGAQIFRHMWVDMTVRIVATG